MKTDINNEAYEVSSELFSFKDMRRGVIEHGRLCYIEGYKKYAELFSTFLVKNGYFSDEELHKVCAEFDAHLKDTPAVSILTCEDVLRKIDKITPKNEGYPMPCLNLCQKDIVKYYCDTLTNDRRVFRIKKARQKGVSTVLSIIAYLESQNNKNVLYIGCSDPRKTLRLKYNQYFTYRDYTDPCSFIGKRYDLIIIDDPKHCNILADFPKLLVCLSDSENGRLIVSLTPCSRKYNVYNEYKAFFEDKSTEVFSYSTGASDNVDRLLKLNPEAKNEVYGEFID